jgi:carbon monoxide dehydrogenase subunit G
MASIHTEIFIDAPPQSVWDAVRDVGALHTRLVPGFARIVTFASGLVARERIVTVDDDGRRLVWSVVDGWPTHHNGALQVFAEGQGSRVVWIADVLPNELAQPIGAMMKDGMTAMKRAMEHQFAEA